MTKRGVRIYSAALDGIDATIVEVEADINVGLHAFNIVGLGDRSLTEAKERVNSALKNSGIKPPNRENRKITINLAPADIKKTGAHYDLAIAIGYLLATRQVKRFDGEKKIFLGELALDGRLRPVNGALNIAQRAAREGFTHLFVPRENANEAAAIDAVKVIALADLRDAIAAIETPTERPPVSYVPTSTAAHAPSTNLFAVRGQENAKRALVIAAAGRHNILLVGEPGVGKTFLSQTLAGIMPELSRDETIETTKVWSAAGLGPAGLICDRPFRAPHHSASLTALIGGGPDAHPGEISLAHNGVLFLDELPEFQKNAIESLRQPIESGTIRLARAKRSIVLPARFLLAAAMNPCPCGYYGAAERECTCSAYEVIKYQKRISGPLLDRIDLQVKVGRVPIEDLNAAPDAQSGTRIAVLRATIASAAAIQFSRYGKMNGDLSAEEIQEHASIDPSGRSFLESLNSGDVSPRGYYRLIKTARTIADLEGERHISAEHLAEAFSYRIRSLS